MQLPSLFLWNIYEITTKNTEIHGVMLRGRIRKLGLEKGFNVLCENASDTQNCVRFAVLSTNDADIVTNYLQSIIPDVYITNTNLSVANPVLSKLKVNHEERYKI